MTRITFQEVAIRGKRRWKDAEGKWHQETRKFWQTINPFNLGENGEPKTAEQIMAALRQERSEWLVRGGQGETK